ncbi:hypothetical protein Hanom_Chr12g01134101 [Helianthus anomalus]
MAIWHVIATKLLEQRWYHQAVSPLSSCVRSPLLCPQSSLCNPNHKTMQANDNTTFKYNDKWNWKDTKRIITNKCHLFEIML